jgi:4'-phosphopantetheinyl transferase
VKTFPDQSPLPGLQKRGNLTLSSTEIHLFLLSYDPEIAPLWNRNLQEVLSAEERHSFAAISSLARQREYLLSRFLTRFCLSTYTGEKMLDLKLVGRKDGKPQLLNPLIRFNLSHTEGLIALALGRMELGVDVERVETQKSSDMRYLTLARRFFTPEENSFISNLPDIEKNLAFLRLFTLKEALGKAMGVGLKGAFSSGSLPLPSPQSFTWGKWWCFTKCISQEDYTFALAAEAIEKEFPLVKIFHWDEESVWVRIQSQKRENVYE